MIPYHLVDMCKGLGQGYIAVQVYRSIRCTTLLWTENIKETSRNYSFVCFVFFFLLLTSINFWLLGGAHCMHYIGLHSGKF